MSEVFEKSNLAGMTLQNRILRSATHEGLGDAHGRPKKELLGVYETLAKNQVGAIITGYAAIQANGRVSGSMRMLDSDDFIVDYRPITVRISTYGVPLIIQLAHGGALCSPNLIKAVPVAPSAIKLPLYPTKPRELKEPEILEIINNFVAAIERARNAGFSGVQLHAAHGYLLAEFLSPRLNQRTDIWGGSTENRFRIVGEIITRARHLVGDYPILIKLSAHDNLQNGIRVEEAIKIARLLECVGCDAIEVSCGNVDGLNSIRVTEVPYDAIFRFLPRYANLPPIKKGLMRLLVPYIYKTYRPLHNYNLPAARRIKEQIKTPVIVVGGIRRLADIESIITSHYADYVSMSRPFIVEPNIVMKFASEKQSESRCLNCGYCLLGLGSKGLKCYYGKEPVKIQ